MRTHFIFEGAEATLGVDAEGNTRWTFPPKRLFFLTANPTETDKWFFRFVLESMWVHMHSVEGREEYSTESGDYLFFVADDFSRVLPMFRVYPVSAMNNLPFRVCEHEIREPAELLALPSGTGPCRGERGFGEAYERFAYGKPGS